MAAISLPSPIVAVPSSSDDVASASKIASRAEQLFVADSDALYRRVDRWFMYLMLGQWLFAIFIAATFSPYTWAGRVQSINVHVPIAVGIGGAISALPIFLILRYPGATLTRWTIAVAQMLWSALLIHLSGGRIETHFHVFGSLAFLAFYRDWKVLLPATIVVAADHLVRQMMWPESVYGIINPEWWRFLEHAFWVVFEDVFLVVACVAGMAEIKRQAMQRAVIEITEHVHKEMEIAGHIQESILPRGFKLPGVELSAKMLPAANMGGDYYDVLPVPHGCWIGIGDVAGHGVSAGLVMMQTQSVLSTLVQQSPDGKPAQLIVDANRVLYDNIRRRMRQDEHITLSLLRYDNSGKLVIAGAHEELIIVRESGTCELLEVKGTWLGAVENIAASTVETEVTLGERDVLVLYTDGITEARDPTGRQFGLQKLCDNVTAARDKPVDTIRDGVLAEVKAWIAGGEQDDDITLIVMRRAKAAA